MKHQKFWNQKIKNHAYKSTLKNMLTALALMMTIEFYHSHSYSLQQFISYVSNTPNFIMDAMIVLNCTLVSGKGDFPRTTARTVTYTTTIFLQ